MIKQSYSDVRLSTSPPCIGSQNTCYGARRAQFTRNTSQARSTDTMSTATCASLLCTQTLKTEVIAIYGRTKTFRTPLTSHLGRTGVPQHFWIQKPKKELGARTYCRASPKRIALPTTSETRSYSRRHNVRQLS